ncbi:hypothetical protein Q9251_04390, partial [Alkalihalobacillus macyae]|nr:hypothetical protein [Alkalihalobacillus macyae]
KNYIFATIITAFTLAFIVENLLRWVNVYDYIKWNNVYSLLAYLGIGLIVKWLMNIFNNIYMSEKA